MSHDTTWLLDILREARRAREVVEGIDRETFLSDWHLQYITVRCIEIIGEAANRISESFQAEHPTIAWSAIIGMRNILIHHYHRVDYEMV